MKQRIGLYVRANAFRKGVLGSSRGWFAVWAGLAVTKFVRKRLGKEPVVAERFVLRPGETVVISDTGITRRDFGRIDR